MATTETAAVAIRDDEELVSSGDRLAAEITALAVVDNATFQRAAELSRGLAGWIKTAEAFFAPMKSAAHKAWRTVCDRENEVIKPKRDLKDALSGKLAIYEAAQERKRREAEEAQRREQEQLEAEERQRVAAEEARLLAEAEERRLQDAVDAEERGDTATAERLIEEPIVVETVLPTPVFVPPIQVAKPEAEGVSFSSRYSAKLYLLVDVVKAAASGNTNALACLAFNQVGANRLATSLGPSLVGADRDTAVLVPGVRVIRKRITATKA